MEEDRNMAGKEWYKIENERDVFSPSLLVYPDRIERNIERMVAIAGDTGRLRPHVKTCKMPEIIRMQLAHGITRFKCATIAEAEMTAACGAKDVLLAMQPVGPNIERFFSLKRAFRETAFSCTVDSAEIIRQLSDKAVKNETDAELWLDLNTGMDRTGIRPGKDAIEIYRMMNSLPNLKAAGFHVYDGHIREKDPEKRRRICDDAFAPVERMREELRSEGFPKIRIVAGGSPTFPVHAARGDVESSPGTVLLWDFGYSSSYSDYGFLHAAVLFTRVISKPAAGIVCLDLGHKAVASEMPQPRIMIPGIDDLSITGHNEEHMVIRTSQASRLLPGDAIYAIPWHICPTVDRYDTVNVVTGSRVTGEWKVEARKRRITI